jgi:hypothetical protein
VLAVCSVVWRFGEYFSVDREDYKPLTFGYAATVEEAEERMREAVGPCPEREIRRCARPALLYHRKLVDEKRRMRPPSREKGSTRVEFVYREFYDNEDSKYHAIPHRIIRRTVKNVFVNINPYREDSQDTWDGGWGTSYLNRAGRDIWDGRTYRLNRAELEQIGSTYSRSAWDFLRERRGVSRRSRRRPP